MKTSQVAWIAKQLETRGTITRNQCLSRFISRLAARIADLRAEGWQIAGERLPKKNGVDYRYTLISKPQ
jgi:hypothetical protein